jgi:FkbM family methyltransferase
MKNLGSCVQVFCLRIFLILMSLVNQLSSNLRENFHPLGIGVTSRFLSKFFNPKNSFTIQIGKNHKGDFTFFLKDYYWSTLLLPWKKYEPEIQEGLDQILQPGRIFIDCGANIGYWSVYASTVLPPKDIIAIEPFPYNYSQLVKNSLQNTLFQSIQYGVTNEDNQKQWLSGTNHASMRIKEYSMGDQGIWITSITLDSVLEKHIRPDSEKVILKLDVEGAEIKALQGAKKLLAKNPIIIFEDQGKDWDNKTSKFIVHDLKYKIYVWKKNIGFQEISLSDVSKIKGPKCKASNFFAMSEDPEN